MNYPTVGIEYEKNFFYNGETVRGFVLLSILKAEKIKSITLKAKGFARVAWTERHGKTSTTYSSSEQYYHITIELLNTASSPKKLEAGLHKFEFSFSLPRDIPSSFRSRIGKVKHRCKVEVDSCNRVFKVKSKASFSVEAVYNLNENPTCKEPVVLKKEKRVHSFPLRKNGSLSATLNLDRSGYVPQERIMINAKCENRSAKHTTLTEVYLKKYITYITKSNKRLTKKNLLSVSHAGVGPGQDDIWSQEPLFIPTTSSAHLKFCNIITIEYALILKFIPAGLSSSLKIKTPITIGTIPIMRDLTPFVENETFTPSPFTLPLSGHFSTPPLFHTSNTASLLKEGIQLVFQTMPSPPRTVKYPNLSPPSYSEIFGDEGPETDSDNDQEEQTI